MKVSYFSKVLHATPKAKKKDKNLPEQRRKMPVYKPNKEAYQDLLQQVEDPSLLERLPDLPFNAARSALFR